MSNDPIIFLKKFTISLSFSAKLQLKKALKRISGMIIAPLFLDLVSRL